MNELALFAGAGGGILGGQLLGWRCVGAVEIDPYCREILLQRQEDGALEPFPVWDDIRTFDGKPWRGLVDVISAGFPCQPWSVAGKRQRDADERNLWPDTIRTIREVGPRFALLENVPGLLRTDYFGEILGDLADAGFDADWQIVSAAEVGAPHVRKRLWILAHANDMRQLQQKRGLKEERRWTGDGGSDVADTSRLIEREQANKEKPESRSRDAREEFGGGGWWHTEPSVGRVADGVARRMDRLKALGNGQVPRVVVEAWRRLQVMSIWNPGEE